MTSEQRHERHHVDGEADHPHEEERRDDGRRQRERGDQRGPPVAHEHEDDQHGHQAAEEDVRADVLDVLLDEVGVVVDRPHLQGGEGRREPGQRRLDLVGNLHGVGAGLLPHREGHRVRAVQPRGGGLVFVAVEDFADVAHAHRRTAIRAQDDVFDLGDRLELALRAQRDRAAVAFDLAAGDIEVFGRELGSHLAERQVQRFEAARIEVDLDLPHLAAVHFNGRDAVNLLEQRLEIVLHLPARDVGRLGRSDGEQHDRQRRDVEALNRRVFDVLWKRAANSSDLLADFGGGGLRIDFEAQLDADARHAFGGCRDHFLHAVDAGDRVLDRAGDERLDFFGAGAGERHDDVDEREVDLGEEVDAQPRHRDDAEHHEAHDDHRREDGPFDGGIRDPHDRSSSIRDQLLDNGLDAGFERAS